MKLTIKQKQVIYERLLSLECPDLLAALIAERSTRYNQSINTTVFDIIGNNFNWSSTPEESDGSDFWCEMYSELYELEDVV